MQFRAIALARRFREVVLNGTWVANTNYRQTLSDVDVDMANKSVSGLNSIAQLAQHIHYYIAGINRVFEGGTLDIKDIYSFDFQPITTENDWQQFLQTLWRDSETFANHIEHMADADLSNVFVDEKYGDYARNINGMIEHGYYHLGQIVLLKKQISLD